MNAKPYLLCAAVLIALGAAHPAGAGENPADPAAPDVLDLQQAASLLRVPQSIVRDLAQSGMVPARRIGSRWRFNRVALMEWLQGERHSYPKVTAKARQLAAGAATASGPEPESGASPAASEAFLGSGLSIPELAQTRGAGRNAAPPPLAQGPAAAPAPALDPQQPVGERRSGLSAEETALREQGLALLKGGAKTMELGLAYSRQVAETGLQRVEVLTTVATLTGRYGLAEDLQLTARLPLNHRRTRVLGASLGSGTASATDHFAGDLALTLLGVGLRENVGRPNLIWSVDAVLPTGPGDAGLGTGIVFSKSYDPVVLFAGLNYLHGLRTDHRDPRRSLAKHNVGFNLGYAYAINDAIALSGQFAGNYRTARSDSVLPPERERYLIQLGVTWQLGRGLFIDPSVSFGVGGTSPDMSFGTNLVYSF